MYKNEYIHHSNPSYSTKPQGTALTLNTYTKPERKHNFET